MNTTTAHVPSAKDSPGLTRRPKAKAAPTATFLAFWMRSRCFSERSDLSIALNADDDGGPCRCAVVVNAGFVGADGAKAEDDAARAASSAKRDAHVKSMMGINLLSRTVKQYTTRR